MFDQRTSSTKGWHIVRIYTSNPTEHSQLKHLVPLQQFIVLATTQTLAVSQPHAISMHRWLIPLDTVKRDPTVVNASM